MTPHDSPLTAYEFFRIIMIVFCIVAILTWIAYEVGRAITRWFDMREWRRMSLPPPSRDCHRVGDIRTYK